jgi:hypothetical protein
MDRKRDKKRSIRKVLVMPSSCRLYFMLYSPFTLLELVKRVATRTATTRRRETTMETFFILIRFVLSKLNENGRRFLYQTPARQTLLQLSQTRHELAGICARQRPDGQLPYVMFLK